MCDKAANQDTTDRKIVMIQPRRPLDTSIHLLIILMLMAAVPGRIYAEVGGMDIPENASVRKYGSGWQCDRGYRKVDVNCKAINVPDNAYPTNRSYGRGWECTRGYRMKDEACVIINVPPNAYLGSSGVGSWKCDRGYRAVDESCVAINVPPNGYLSDNSYGPGWKCDRGHRAAAETCLALIVPENAHIDYSGSDWACNPPYRSQQGRCALRSNDSPAY
jgi:hypothetical protein